jgi:hypothetical protein
LGEDKWIDAEKQQPEDCSYVLVWYEYFRYGRYNCMWHTYGIAYYDEFNERWFGNDLHGEKVKVLSWQPLPESPARWLNENCPESEDD